MDDKLKVEISKTDVIVFGLILKSDIFVNGLGTTDEDSNLYQEAALKLYGVTEESSDKEIQEAIDMQKKDEIELLESLRKKFSK